MKQLLAKVLTKDNVESTKDIIIFNDDNILNDLYEGKSRMDAVMDFIFHNQV